MLDPGSAAKSHAQMLTQEDFSGTKLFDECVKLEESSPSDKDPLFQEINEALTIHGENEERLSYPSTRDAWTGEQEDVANEAAEEDHFVKTLLEEMSGLEAEQEQFEATTRVLRENLQQDAGKEE